MERKAKALPDSISCWKANIYSARRRWISLELYRYYTNDYLILSGRRRHFAEFHCRRYENRNPLEDPTIFGCYQSTIESESHLRGFNSMRYTMQILSTLTLSALNLLFSIRPSTDLKRPLQGTETLLSSLADSFTKGSPRLFVGLGIA